MKKPRKPRTRVSAKAWGAVSTKGCTILCAGFTRAEVVRYAAERWVNYGIWSGSLTLVRRKSTKKRRPVRAT